MANTRSLSSAATAATSPLTYPPSPRHRLRSVDRDEVARVVDLLPPGATWLPAPQHTLPTLPGQPPMIGYLVLVPADQQPPIAFAPQAVAAAVQPAPPPPLRPDRVTAWSGSTRRSAPPRSTAGCST